MENAQSIFKHNANTYPKSRQTK